MPAGQLRERVAFDLRTTVDDGYGNPVTGPFVEQFVAPARIMPLRGGEAVMADRLTGRQPVIITVRYSDAAMQIHPGWQARDVRKGTVFNVTGAANMDEKKIYIDVLAVAGEAT